MDLKTTLSLVFAVILSGSSLAYADQCPVLTADQATSAVKLVDTQKVGKVLSFCQLCGEKVPREVKVTSVSTQPDPFAPFPGMDGFNVDLVISGTPVDLAYTYVKIDNATWVNLGLLANCNAFSFDPNNLGAPGKLNKVQGVSQFLSEKDGAYVPSPIY